MDLFQSMEVFSKVYQEQNFSKVSQLMQMNTSSVSRIISKLEDEMNASLFNRNTRKMVPTELGDKFYCRVQEILSSVNDLKSDLKEYSQKKARVHISGDLSHFFAADILKVISNLNSNCDLEFNFNNEMPDIIAGGFEFALCLTSLKDSGLIARKINDAKMALFDYGTDKKKVFIPKFFGVKKNNVLQILQELDYEFDQVVEVDNFCDAQMLASSTGACSVAPEFYHNLIADKPKNIISMMDNSFLGKNFGLYLVYTYNRYKSDKGREIIDNVIKIVKGKVKEEGTLL